jgi:hypothetical protein
VTPSSSSRTSSTRGGCSPPTQTWHGRVELVRRSRPWRFSTRATVAFGIFSRAAIAAPVIRLRRSCRINSCHPRGTALGDRLRTRGAVEQARRAVGASPTVQPSWVTLETRSSRPQPTFGHKSGTFIRLFPSWLVQALDSSLSHRSGRMNISSQ